MNLDAEWAEHTERRDALVDRLGEIDEEREELRNRLISLDADHAAVCMELNGLRDHWLRTHGDETGRSVWGIFPVEDRSRRNRQE